MNGWFAAAALGSAGVTLLHVIAGGAIAARPLLDCAALGFVAKFTNYYCWHLVTIMIAGLAVSFGYAAMVPAGIELGVMATGLSLAFGLWSLGLAVSRSRRLLALPQWMLFLPIAALGGMGLV